MTKKYTMTKKLGSELFGFSERTYQTWKTNHNEAKSADTKKDHPIIDLLEKYFSEEEIKEFINTRKIKKLEYIDYLHNIEKEKLLKPAEKILNDHSDVSHYILKLIQKYEERYYAVKQKHKEAQNKIKSYIYYGEDESFDEVLEYPEGYISLDSYLRSIIFNSDVLREILGKELLPRYLFDVQQAILEISKEDLIPIIKRHMEYLLEKIESYKTEADRLAEYEEEQAYLLDDYNRNPNYYNIKNFEETMLEKYTVSDYIMALKKFGYETTDSLYSTFEDNVDMIEECDDSLEILLKQIEKLLELYSNYRSSEKITLKEAWDKAVSIAKPKSTEEGGFVEGWNDPKKLDPK